MHVWASVSVISPSCTVSVTFQASAAGWRRQRPVANLFSIAPPPVSMLNLRIPIHGTQCTGCILPVSVKCLWTAGIAMNVRFVPGADVVNIVLCRIIGAGQWQSLSRFKGEVKSCNWKYFTFIVFGSKNTKQYGVNIQTETRYISIFISCELIENRRYHPTIWPTVIHRSKIT